MHINPFKRAKAMIQAIATIMSTVPVELQKAALAGLGQYRSRGHGRGDKFARQSFGGHTNWKQILGGNTCGARECARRIRQRDAAFTKTLAF